MILDHRKGGLTPATATPPASQPVENPRADLGILGNWGVNRVERKEKTAAAKALVKKAVAVAHDVHAFQLDIDATLCKSVMMAKAVPVLGGLMDEMVVRTTHVRLGLESTEHAGIVAEIKARRQRQQEYQHLFEAGQMTESELAEVNALAASRATEGCTRLLRDVDRAHEGLDAHLAGVLSHVKNITKETR